jgi:hypothetical protein
VIVGNQSGGNGLTNTVTGAADGATVNAPMGEIEVSATTEPTLSALALFLKLRIVGFPAKMEAPKRKRGRTHYRFFPRLRVLKLRIVGFPAKMEARSVRV